MRELPARENRLNHKVHGRTPQSDAVYYAGIIREGTENPWIVYEYLKSRYRLDWSDLSAAAIGNTLLREFAGDATPENVLHEGWFNFEAWLRERRRRA